MSTDMKLTLRALSVLLDYPSEALKDHIDEVRLALHSEAALPSAVRARLEPLVQSFENEDLLDLQISYCELFDCSRACSLHLFEHIHGESRERGQAMIDLGQHYIDRGFIMETSELPDFLPLFLEFLSCLPPAEARSWLGEPAHVLAVLEQRLAARNSPYAAIFQALLALANAQPDLAAMTELQQRTSPAETISLDEDWQEAPVNFSAAVPIGGSTGVITKIKAAGRALIATSAG